jgi:hypothetical protein
MGWKIALAEAATAAGKELLQKAISEIVSEIGNFAVGRVVEISNKTDQTLHLNTNLIYKGHFTEAPDAMIEPNTMEVFGVRSGAVGSYVGTTEYTFADLRMGCAVSVGAWLQPTLLNLAFYTARNTVNCYLAPGDKWIGNPSYWGGIKGVTSSVTCESKSTKHRYELIGVLGDRAAEFTLMPVA